MTAGIHEVFRGSTFFSNAGVGKINKNLNIELQKIKITGSTTLMKKTKAMRLFWVVLLWCIQSDFALALENSTLLVRSEYRESSGSTAPSTLIWEFIPTGDKSQMDVYVKGRPEKILSLTYTKEGRLKRVIKLIPDGEGVKEIKSDCEDHPIVLSEGFPAPYDYLAPFDENLTQVKLTKQAGGASFSTLFTRGIEKITLKDALQLKMIDKSRAARIKEKDLGQGLKLISIYKGKERVVRQLWAPDDSFWIFEETSLRQSWNITPQ